MKQLVMTAAGRVHFPGDVIPLLPHPIRAYFSPTGSFAAITNSSGWVDIV
jgi:hypothetical protein